MSDVTITPTGFKSEAREVSRARAINRLLARPTIRTTVGGGGSSSRSPTPTPSTPPITTVSQRINDFREDIKTRSDLILGRSKEFFRSVPSRLKSVNDRFNKSFVPSENSSRLAQVSYAGRNENRKTVSDNALITPKKIRSGFEKVSEKIIDYSTPLSNLVIENVIDKKYSPGSDPNLFFTKPRVSKSSAKAVLSDVLMFSAFNPVMSSGSTSQYTETITADGRRIFIKKSQVRDYLNRLERSGKTVSSPNLQTKLNRIDFLLKNAKDNNARQELLKVARAEYGDSVIKEYFSQNVGLKAKITTTTTQNNVLGFKPQVQSAPLEKTPLLISSVRTTQQNRQNNVLGLKPVTLTKTTTTTNQDSQQRNIFFSSPNIRTTTTTTQDSKSESKQDSKTALRFFSAQTTLQRPSLKNNNSNSRSVKKRVTRITKTSLLPKNSSSFSVSPSSNNPPIIEEGFLTQVKERGKWLTIGKKPLIKDQALALGGFIVDNTTSNTFRIKKTSKKPVKSSFSSFNKQKFRDYKIVKGKRKPLSNTYIEKKGKYRIDTLGEKKGLSTAKLLKQKKKRGFFL